MSYAIDPELAPLLEFLPEGSFSDVEESRAFLAALVEPMNANVDTSGLEIVDREISGPDGAVPVRVYAREGDAPAGGRPALLDIHGGGFVTGNIEMEHAFAVQVARELDAAVVVVDYRLAPEHPFPAGVEDCYSSLKWLHEEAAALGIDPERIAVGGQSAGGGLAAATVLMARDRGGPPVCFQFLGIPELDHRLETASMRAFVDTPVWHRPAAELSWERYLGPDPGTVSPYASPAIATDLARPAAGLRHGDGVRSVARRGNRLRVAHDGSGRVGGAAHVSGDVPRFGDGDDRRRFATCRRGGPGRTPTRPTRR